MTAIPQYVKHTFDILPDLKDLIPPLASDELDQLRANCVDEGIRDPLVVAVYPDADGVECEVLADGHNRYSIAQAEGLEYHTVKKSFESLNEVKLWMIDNQKGRRNLSDWVKLELASVKREILAAKGREKKELAGIKAREKQLGVLSTIDKTPEPTHNTQAALAKDLGWSTGKLAMADKVRKHIEQTGNDDLREKLRANEVSINSVYQDLRKKEKTEEKVRKRKEKAERKKPNGNGWYKLHNCSLSNVHGIAPESLDVIITDPPYPKEYIDTYRLLAEFADKYLKTGGSLLAMAGQSYLPDVIKCLDSAGLKYHWCLSYLTPGGQATQLWDRKVNTFWKPVFWFVKGEYKGDWIGDVAKSDPNDNDKAHHYWGQSESGMYDLVNRFTYPGEVVCDPFCGGGTTGVVCVETGRNFIGIDVDAQAIETTKSRLND
jgi:16S rRNA G966 N2-methylase RsmD